MNPHGLSKPRHATTTQPPRGNLGQALSLLIKKGIFFFCYPLGVEHGDKRWEETDHKHSSISKPLPQKQPVVGLRVCVCFTIGLRCSVHPAVEEAAVTVLCPAVKPQQSKKRKNHE